MSVTSTNAEQAKVCPVHTRRSEGGLAVFSASLGDRKRYLLSRKISPQLEIGQSAPHERICTFIMHNPSTADEVNLDPTSRRCLAIAKALDCTYLNIVNLCPTIATDPRGLNAENTAHDFYNDIMLHQHIDMADIVIVAWGNVKPLLPLHVEAAKYFLRIAKKPIYCLGVNESGEPKHPLYTKAVKSIEDLRNYDIY